MLNRTCFSLLAVWPTPALFTSVSGLLDCYLVSWMCLTAALPSIESSQACACFLLLIMCCSITRIIGYQKWLNDPDFACPLIRVSTLEFQSSLIGGDLSFLSGIWTLFIRGAAVLNPVAERTGMSRWAVFGEEEKGRRRVLQRCMRGPFCVCGIAGGWRCVFLAVKRWSDRAGMDRWLMIRGSVWWEEPFSTAALNKSRRGMRQALHPFNYPCVPKKTFHCSFHSLFLWDWKVMTGTRGDLHWPDSPSDVTTVNPESFQWKRKWPHLWEVMYTGKLGIFFCWTLWAVCEKYAKLLLNQFLWMNKSYT